MRKGSSKTVAQAGQPEAPSWHARAAGSQMELQAEGFRLQATGCRSSATVGVLLWRLHLEILPVDLISRSSLEIVPSVHACMCTLNSSTCTCCMHMHARARPITQAEIEGKGAFSNGTGAAATAAAPVFEEPASKKAKVRRGLQPPTLLKDYTLLHLQVYSLYVLYVLYISTLHTYSSTYSTYVLCIRTLCPCTYVLCSTHLQVAVSTASKTAAAKNASTASKKGQKTMASFFGAPKK